MGVSLLCQPTAVHCTWRITFSMSVTRSVLVIIYMHCILLTAWSSWVVGVWFQRDFASLVCLVWSWVKHCTRRLFSFFFSSVVTKSRSSARMAAPLLRSAASDAVSTREARVRCNRNRWTRHDASPLPGTPCVDFVVELNKLSLWNAHGLRQNGCS